MTSDNNISLDTAVTHVAAGIGRVDAGGCWQAGNGALCELLAVDADLPPRPLQEWFAAEDRAWVERTLDRIVQGDRRSDVRDLALLRADGRELRIRLDLAAIPAPDADRPDTTLVMIEDMTAAAQIRQQLEASEARLESIFRAMADGVIVFDADGKILLANTRAAELLGMQRPALLDATLADLPIVFSDPFGEPLDESQRPVARTLASGRAETDVPLSMTLPDGSRRWLEVSTDHVDGERAPGAASVVATFSDITRRWEAEQRLRESEERLTLVFEGAKLGFWDWNFASGAFVFSEGAANRLGYSRGDVESSTDAVLELVHVDDREQLVEQWKAHIEGQRREFDMDVRMRRKAGDYSWRNIRGRIVWRDKQDRPVRLAGTLMDIGERKRLEAQLKELATTDGLTGLLNRRFGQEQLDSELASAKRLGHPVGFVLLDIDHFKTVNDRFGHDVGDRVLRDVAVLLKDRARRTDHVARWGGEEFAVILPGSDARGAQAFAETVLEAMRELESPGESLLSASLGAVAWRKGESVSELVKRADRLMYKAKQSGRARVEFEAG